MKNGVYRTTSAEGAPPGTPIDLDQPVFEAFARALSFPKWFGGNWDALEDCLTEHSGVLVIRNATPGEELGTLVDVLEAVADYWRARKKPFVAVFVDPHAKLRLPELPR